MPAKSSAYVALPILFCIRSYRLVAGPQENDTAVTETRYRIDPVLVLLRRRVQDLLLIIRCSQRASPGCPAATKLCCHVFILMLDSLSARVHELLLHLSPPFSHTFTTLPPSLDTATLLLFDMNKIKSQFMRLQIVAPQLTFFCKQLHCYVANRRQGDIVTTSYWH